MPEPLFPTGHDGSDDRAERALRRALAAQASAVEPGPAPRVGELVDRGRPRRWPAALGVAASVALLAVTSAVALRPDVSRSPVAGPSVTASSAPSAPSTAVALPEPSDESSVAPSAISSEPTTSSTTTDSSEPVGTTTIVWACLADGDGTDPTVAPERRTSPLPSGTGMTDQEARVAAAVQALDSRPALDPDYVNYWALKPQDDPRPGRTDVRISESGTTVDFAGAAPGGLATGATFRCLTETLVRTVVSNGGSAPVTFLLDGRPAAFAELDFSEPARPSTDLLAGGWILDPYEGQRVRPGTVTLSGTATAFEANVNWEVLGEDGVVVAEGFTMAGSNGEYGPWTVPVELSPGAYSAVLWAENMAGSDEGPGPRLWEDTKTFTVVP